MKTRPPSSLIRTRTERRLKINRRNTSRPEGGWSIDENIIMRHDSLRPRRRSGSRARGHPVYIPAPLFPNIPSIIRAIDKTSSSFPRKFRAAAAETNFFPCSSPTRTKVRLRLDGSALKIGQHRRNANVAVIGGRRSRTCVKWRAEKFRGSQCL